MDDDIYYAKKEYGGIILSLDVSPDGRFLLVGTTDDGVFIVELKKGGKDRYKKRRAMQKAFENVYARMAGLGARRCRAKFFPDGRFLAIWTTTSEFFIVEVKGTKEGMMEAFKNPYAEMSDYNILDLDISQDGKFMALIIDSGKLLIIRLKREGSNEYKDANVIGNAFKKGNIHAEADLMKEMAEETPFPQIRAPINVHFSSDGSVFCYNVGKGLYIYRKGRDKPKGSAKVIGGCLSKFEAGQLRGAIRGAESKGEVFDLYPQADRYGEELDGVLKFLGKGPIRYQKFGKFLEKERVYIKVVSKDSELFKDSNTGFVVEDTDGKRREVYAFSMFNPEDNPDGPIYATIYIPEPVILKAKEYDFLEGFAVDLVHELSEIEDIRRRGLAGKILDGDMDEEAHRLAELAEFDFGVIDGISTLDLFLAQQEPDISSIKQATEGAVGRYRDKGLIEYATMPEGLIQVEIPQHDGQVGIILDSSLILNEIGMRECLGKLDKSRYIVWVMAKDK